MHSTFINLKRHRGSFLQISWGDYFPGEQTIDVIKPDGHQLFSSQGTKNHLYYLYFSSGVGEDL